MKVKVKRDVLRTRDRGSISANTYYSWLRRGSADLSLLSEWCAGHGIDISDVVLNVTRRETRREYRPDIIAILGRYGVSISEFAKLAGVPRASVYGWIRTGRCSARSKIKIDGAESELRERML
jgi:hypothetical protein